MSTHSNEPSNPLSKQELVSCLWSVENTNFKNSKSQYTQEHEKSQNWTPPIPYKGCRRGPILGTYSDRGFQDFLLLINIFHIIKSLYCRKIGTSHDQRAVGIEVGSEHDFQTACLPPVRCLRDLRDSAGRDQNSVARWTPLVLVTWICAQSRVPTEKR